MRCLFYSKSDRSIVLPAFEYLGARVIWFQRALATVWELRVFSCCKQLVQHELLLRKWEPNQERYVVQRTPSSKCLVSECAGRPNGYLHGKSKDGKLAQTTVLNRMSRNAPIQTGTPQQEQERTRNDSKVCVCLVMFFFFSELIGTLRQRETRCQFNLLRSFFFLFKMSNNLTLAFAFMSSLYV